MPMHSGLRLASALDLEPLAVVIARPGELQQCRARASELPVARSHIIELEHPLDYLGVAVGLAALLAKTPCRYALCGVELGGEGGGAVGPALAELLGWVHFGEVHVFEVKNAQVCLERRSEDSIQRLCCPENAVFCVAATAGDPRAWPTRAQPPTIDTYAIAELVADAELIGERTRLAEHLRYEARPQAVELFSNAEALVARLREDGHFGST